MKPVVISFGLLIFALLVLFHLPGIFYFDNDLQAWIAISSITFLVIGVVLSRKMFPQKQIVIQPGSATLSYERLLKAGISKREADILLLVNEGLSNLQIADKLFLSENTIKKHLSNLFRKLQVERRTEAIKKAQELSIIA